jgi:hypothetical protein
VTEAVFGMLHLSLYFHTQGIHALVVILFQLSQQRAIRDRTECLTEASIEQTAIANFALLEGALDALRANDARAIERYEDLISSELENLKKRVQASGKHEALAEVATSEKKRKSDRRRLVSMLLALGVDGKVAQHVVDKISKSDSTTEARREQILSQLRVILAIPQR